MLIIRCPTCQAMLQFREEHAGKHVECPKCQQVHIAAAASPVSEKSDSRAGSVPYGRLLSGPPTRVGIEQTVNPLVASETSDMSLGSKQHEFHASNLGQLGRGCLGFICTAIGIAAIAAVVVGVASGKARGVVKVSIFGGLFLAGGIALLKSIRGARGTRVEVFDEGWILLQPGSEDFCRWDEILTVVEKEAVDGNEAIQAGMNSETRAFYLHLRSGQVLVLKSYISRLARLGDIIKRETLPCLLPVYQEKLKTSGSSQFGAICLEANGIEVQGDRLPWSEVQKVRREGGWIKVYRRGTWLNWRKVKLMEVPNAHVLLSLVAQHYST